MIPVTQPFLPPKSELYFLIKNMFVPKLQMLKKRMLNSFSNKN